MATFPIYQLYVELQDYEPKMWRRFQIMNDITIAKLAYILMTLFELRNNYAYEFRTDELTSYLRRHQEYEKHPERLEAMNKTFKKYRYGIVSKKNMYLYKRVEGYEPIEDATKVQLRTLLVAEKDNAIFYYDPEADWKINIVLEKITIDKNLYAKELPRVLGGEGFGIIELYGNAKNLKKFRDTLKANRWRNSINYKYYTTEQSKSFYFDRFDTEDMNFRIKTLPRSFQDTYEQNMYVSNRMMRIMKRKYKVYKKQ